MKFKNDVVCCLNRKVPTIACFLDIEKAFDTIWIEVIFKMLFDFHFSAHICQVIYNYLKNRKFAVKINGSTSSAYDIVAGVPQGGVLSAILYNIYLADLPKPTTHINKIQRLQYADDTLIYVSVRNLQDGQDRINAYLKVIETYYLQWKIKLNPAKAEAIVFKGPNKLHSKAINRNHRNIKLKIGLKDTIIHIQVHIYFIHILI